jgi:BirA family biotin operon repressor/biotin-[acetyl-CoA-carboxylase] ligase
VQLGSSFQARTLDLDELQGNLDTRFIGKGDKLLYLPVVDSTNTFAMQLAHERPDEGLVVLTDSQTAGKGRQGRRWADISGCNVLSSTLLLPIFPPHFLIMIASLAVVDAITETCAVSASIKWPNDVLVGERKVAGILIETSHDRSGQFLAILGIGVNVNGHLQDVPVGSSLVTVQSGEGSSQKNISPPEQASLTPAATTLEVECGHKVNRELFIAHLLQHIESDYLVLQQEARNSFSMTYEPASRSLWQRWRRTLSTLGRSIQVRQGDTILSGIAEDVDGNGELLLRCDSGLLARITWGDVGYPVT